MRVDFADIKPSVFNFVLFFFMAVVTIPLGKFLLAYLANVMPLFQGLSDLANSI